MSADFHLYLIAPLIFISLYAKPILGIILSILGIIIGVIASIMPKLLGIYNYYEWREFDTIYDLSIGVRWHFYGTHMHLSPFMLGMLLGYILRKWPNVYLGGKIGESIIWIVTGIMSSWAFYWHSNWLIEPPSSINIILWNGFGKLLWVSGVAWIIFACSTGRAGNKFKLTYFKYFTYFALILMFLETLNKILSHQKLKPWSRLTLGVCILHLLPIVYRLSTVRDNFLMSNYTLVTIFIYLLR
jgi:hypothetical protein